MMEKISCIIVNISWNSNQWRGVSDDKTGFGWVKGGNIPGESWNFDFENEDNVDGLVHGFCQFKNPPKSSEMYGHLVIFSSKDVASDKENKIVGVYGKANVLKITKPLKSGRPCNITAPKEMCVFFENNLNHSDKRFLEGKQKIGQVGFNKLVDKNNVLNVIDEARKTNPNESESLEKIKMWLKDKELVDGKDSFEEEMDDMSSVENNLNMILYGPPGTGKTYVTRQKAVEICDGVNFSDDEDRREEIKKRYDELKNEGRIAFCTFHQSMSYEDFVEGIKPKIDDDDEVIRYEIKEGILKGLVDKINKENFVNGQDNFDDSFKKLMLKFEDNGSLSIGNLSGKGSFDLKLNKSQTGFVLNHIENGFINKEQLYNVYRGMPGVPSTAFDNYRKAIIAEMKKTYYLQEYKKGTEEKGTQKNYVLIIDEINRGNIAQIFGELITLIEDSKRKGEEDETSVILPYSHEEFCLPPNLYILGTMNTADRSVEALDTALRRRFVFEEMMPKPDVLNPNVEGLNLPSLLRGLNRRIEYLLDRDHTIGHAYFINVQTKKDLDDVFRNKIIPQLQEYFYSDWRKIQLILGEDIVGKESNEFEKIFGSAVNDVDVESSKDVFSVKEKWDVDAYKKICAE